MTDNKDKSARPVTFHIKVTKLSLRWNKSYYWKRKCRIRTSDEFETSVYTTVMSNVIPFWCFIFSNVFFFIFLQIKRHKSDNHDNRGLYEKPFLWSDMVIQLALCVYIFLSFHSINFVYQVHVESYCHWNHNCFCVLLQVCL